MKVPSYRRAKKAVIALRRFMKKHMKSEDIHLGRYVNEYLWSRGIKNPPYKVEVQVQKRDDNKVIVELVGKPLPSLEKKEKEEKGKIEQIAEKFTGKKKETKKPEVQEAEVVKEEKKSEAPKTVKKEEAKTTQETSIPEEKQPKKVTENIKPLSQKK